MTKTTASELGAKTKMITILKRCVFWSLLIASISLSTASFMTLSHTIGPWASLLVSALVGIASLNWLANLNLILLKKPNLRLENNCVLISEVDADIEILKGFKDEYYLGAFALQIRLCNSSEQIIHYKISSFQAIFFGMDEKWEYSPKNGGIIASSKSKVFSTKKMKLRNPIKIVSGITQIAGSMDLVFAYQDAEGTQKFQDVAVHKITININNEGNSLRYRFEIN